MKLSLVIATACLAGVASAQPVQYLNHAFVDYSSSSQNTVVASPKGAAPIVVSKQDWEGVRRVAADLVLDIERVTGQKPDLVQDSVGKSKTAIIVGTIGKSLIIDKLIKNGKLNPKGISGQWESYVIQTVSNPIPGVDKAIVVAGSDKRGTIYGCYEISEQSGVSPWYWWADVPVKKHATLAIKSGRFVQASPKVKYRGIFINDEAPCLSNWVYKNFGEYKHEFYVHVFELLLRLRANYLWPAMWNNRFNEDDPENPRLADMYGIVMGTSHVEPMGRADKEWNKLGYSGDQWNYAKFPNELEKFWADGVRRNKPYETITTMAMRGKIDTPMSEDENINLLERIVAAQRKILAKEVNPDVTQIPQLWCLYKEVQSYYDHGMRVPDDVTLLWADDNWGNIRRLPTPEERNRKGGAGVYYHFDYVGGPRNYKWVDTNPLPRIWEQMHMAYERRADRIWIVNVGDIKPNEFPTEFFIRMGWDPDRWNQNQLQKYTMNWVQREFGPEYSLAITELLEKYAKYNSRRKPELLDPNTYSLTNYQEADRIIAEWEDLAKRSTTLMGIIPANQRDAYFQLVHYPIAACENLNKLYVAAAKNRLFAKQGRASTNLAHDLVAQLFQKDIDLQKQYHSINNGKWDHMMDQTHIGYTNWQQPDKNSMPEVVRIPPNRGAALGVAVEGSETAWPSLTDKTIPTTPRLSRIDRQQHYIEIFNRGTGKLEPTITAQDPWLRFNRPDDYSMDRRLYLSVDWSQVPVGTKESWINISGPNGAEVRVRVPIQYLTTTQEKDIHGFVETNGVIAIDAGVYAKRVGNSTAQLRVLPDLGRLGSGLTMMPSTAPKQSLTSNPVYTEFPIYLFTGGDIKVQTVLSPTQHLQPGKGLTYAISIDGGTPQVVNMHENYVYFTPTWEASVAQNAIIRSVTFSNVKPGKHTIRFYAIDAGVVLQRIVVDAGGLKPSYLGPPDSIFIQETK